MLPLPLWPPPRIEGSVLARAVPLPSAEDSSVEHSSHTQHERLLPTPSSRPVTTIRPTMKEIPAPATLPINTERRRVRGTDANLENVRLILSKTFPKGDLFRKPPGMVVTAPGSRAR